MEISLPGRRVAQLWVGGADDGPAVLVCHGTPDTRWVAMTGDDAARAAGVRLVCVNRPGYGASTATTSTMTSVAHDAVAVLDALGIHRVAVVGMSVGAAYAAALAATHPDRVAALAVVAAPTETRSATGTVDEAVEEHRPEFTAWRATVDPGDADDTALAGRWTGGLPAADAAVLSAALSPADVAASAREALVQPEGYLRDAALFFSDWGVSFADVRCPAHLWFGEHDDRNGPANGRWWAARLPHADLTVTPTTHLATLLTGWSAILGTLRASLD